MKACQRCKKAKHKCDDSRPCRRCIFMGKQAECSADVGQAEAGVAAGSIASGVLCAALTHPFDTCKSIIQGDLEAGGLTSTARALYAENGLQGFFRGYPARAAMICCCFFIFNVGARRPRGLPYHVDVTSARQRARLAGLAPTAWGALRRCGRDSPREARRA